MDSLRATANRLARLSRLDSPSSPDCKAERTGRDPIDTSLLLAAADRRPEQTAKEQLFHEPQSKLRKTFAEQFADDIEKTRQSLSLEDDQMIASYLQTSLLANRYSIRLSAQPEQTAPTPAAGLQSKVRELFEGSECAIDLRRLLRRRTNV